MRSRQLAICLCAVLRAAAQTSEVSGQITDPSGASVAQARIRLTRQDRSAERSAISDGVGWYAIPLVAPGAYSLEVKAAGFQTLLRERIVLNASQPARIDCRLVLGDASTTVTVTAEPPAIHVDNGALATTVDANFVDRLPINGRSFQALLALVPGAIPTAPDQAGGFHVNGQRSTANGYTIDGVSANVASPFQTGTTFSLGGGNLLATTPSGTTQSVASMEELQEFTVASGGYGTPLGGQSGAQVAFVTRSGTNRFHGSLYDYFRNEKLDANDWFLNRQGMPRQALRENNAGGSLGGPIRRDRAFFFLSYELDPYRTPNAQSVVVPSAAYRSRAAAALKPLLDAFPQPVGQGLGANSGLFTNSIPERGSSNAASLKWDQAWRRGLTTFVRYHRTPSRVSDSNITTWANTYTNTQTLTAGAVKVLNPHATDELHVNWSRNASGQQNPASGEFGTVPPPDSAFIAPGTNATVGQSYVTYTLSDADSAAMVLGRQAKFVMRQFELNDTLHLTLGGHRLQFGADWRRLSPGFDANPYILTLRIVDGPTAAASGGVGKGEAATLRMHALGAFAGDTWRIGSRWSVDLGLRWDLVTPPGAVEGPQPYAARNFDADNPAAATFAPAGTPLWSRHYRNFAPRLGTAWQASTRPGRETVLRGAVGVNYDLGLGIVAGLSGMAPFTRSGPAVSGTYPEILSQLTLPPLSTGKVSNSSAVVFFDPQLKQPYTAAWNAGVEQALGTAQALTVDYVGNSGHRLLRVVTSTGGNAQGGIVTAESNQAYSRYHALQVQFRRRLTNGLQCVANYTWSHAIDNSSTELVLADVVAPGSVLPPRSQRGASAYDVRHAVSAAATYELPVRRGAGMLARIASGWSVHPMLRAYSAKPVDVTYMAYVFGASGLQWFIFHPNLVAGQPLWLNDPSQPRHALLNAAAFSVPPGLNPSEGTLGRNAIRGFPSSQVDLGLHRTFAPTERIRIRAAIETFNVFNHPNFSNPDSLVASGSLGRYNANPLFGAAATMLGRPGNAVLGTGGLSPVYAFGTQRDIQLALRVTF